MLRNSARLRLSRQRSILRWAIVRYLLDSLLNYQAGRWCGFFVLTSAFQQSHKFSKNFSPLFGEGAGQEFVSSFPRTNPPWAGWYGAVVPHSLSNAHKKRLRESLRQELSQPPLAVSSTLPFDPNSQINTQTLSFALSLILHFSHTTPRCFKRLYFPQRHS